MLSPAPRLTFDSRSVVVIAGIPGAGKTTFIRRLVVDRDAVAVIDTEDRRDEAHSTGTRRPRNLVVDHYLRTARAIRSGRPVVIHSRGTHLVSRWGISFLARATRRPAHLVLLDVDRPTAEAGQASRSRVVGRSEMNRQVARWHRLVRHAQRGRLPGEGWRSVTVLDRPSAAAVGALDFPATVRVSVTARVRGRWQERRAAAG